MWLSVCFLVVIGLYSGGGIFLSLLNFVFFVFIVCFCFLVSALYLLCFGLLAVDVLSVTLANLGDLANFSNVTN